MPPRLPTRHGPPTALPLRTARLRLREQVEADASFVRDLMNEPEWLRYIGDRGVRSVADAERYIRDGARAMYARLGFGLYLVETAADRAPVGLCGLLRRDGRDYVELGFAVAAAHRRRGYAREAAGRVLEHARDDLALARVAAVVQADNTASLGLLAGLGFVPAGQVGAPPDPPLRLLAVTF